MGKIHPLKSDKGSKHLKLWQVTYNLGALEHWFRDLISGALNSLKIISPPSDTPFLQKEHFISECKPTAKEASLSYLHYIPKF